MPNAAARAKRKSSRAYEKWDRSKPAHEIVLENVTVSIWPSYEPRRERDPANHGFYVVPSCRLKKDGEWVDSTEFRDVELLLLARALDEAYAWVNMLGRRLPNRFRRF